MFEIISGIISVMLGAVIGWLIAVWQVKRNKHKAEDTPFPE